jgi:lysophospholipase L1-like esterase
VTTWHRFVAVGDSFTEGLEDRLPYGGHRGWADRVAQRMAERTDNFTYANLAVRGRKLEDIVRNQLPQAIDMDPDLISIAGGVNDMLRPKWDMTVSGALLEEGVLAARDSGADVLLFAFGNIARRSRALGTVTARLAEYREITLALAEEHDCYVVDFWPETVFDDSRF